MILLLAVLSLVCALVPAVMFCVNLRAYKPPPDVGDRTLPAISVLIPARNEAHGIEAAVRAALASKDVELEVIVMDDSSTDGTVDLVLSMAARDSRLRLERAPGLPTDWNGKQHACWQLARAARNPILCFVDADVRLGPACVARMANFLCRRESASNSQLKTEKLIPHEIALSPIPLAPIQTSDRLSLVSGFPQQITVTGMEWLLLPLIHFVLLGFLPISRMRFGTDPAFAAGCGQFLMARRDDYFACGGHSGIKLTMHDGLRLPKLFREAGFRTDLADITDLATCRMYRSAAEVWNGLAKNATEGLAAPARIVPVTTLLLLGQVLPFFPLLLLLASPLIGILLGAFGMDIHFNRPIETLIYVVLLVGAAWLPRWLAVKRFKQVWRSALLHPFGILLLLAVQWYALIRKILRAPVSWKDRAYVPDPPASK